MIQAYMCIYKVMPYHMQAFARPENLFPVGTKISYVSHPHSLFVHAPDDVER